MCQMSNGRRSTSTRWTAQKGNCSRTWASWFCVQCCRTAFISLYVVCCISNRWEKCGGAALWWWIWLASVGCAVLVKSVVGSGGWGGRSKLTGSFLSCGVHGPCICTYVVARKDHIRMLGHLMKQAGENGLVVVFCLPTRLKMVCCGLKGVLVLGTYKVSKNLLTISGPMSMKWKARIPYCTIQWSSRIDATSL